MTRKERVLKNLKQMCSDGRYLGSGSYIPLEVLEDFEVAIKALEQEPTTKENLCGDCMDFPNTFDEFARDYGFKDSKEIYTNGSELIPVFRVKQWLEHVQEPITKIEESNFSQEQYLADIQSAYDCGKSVINKIRAEIAEYGSIWVEYKITGNSNRDIEKLVGDVLSQAKKQVLEIIDKYTAESEN